MSELRVRPEGGYRFLPGIPAFSEGIVADDRHRIVHVRLRAAVPTEAGYGIIQATLADHGRPLKALCGVELRLPRQLPVDEFRELNRGYVETLRDDWELFVDGVNPVPRCNLALTHDSFAEPSLHGFSFTVPTDTPRPGGADFVTAGINDAALVYGPHVFEQLAAGAALEPLDDAPRSGDVSATTLERRLRFILARAEERLRALGVGWKQATQVELYLGRPLGNLLERVVLPAVAPAGRHGLRWFAGLAPFLGPEAEMDVRGFAQEIVLDASGVDGV